VQLGYGEKKEKRTSKALRGHFERASSSPKQVVREFRDFETEVSLGDEVRLEDVFEEGERIDVAGTSKGKGFQGVVKRHGFSGVGMATHGQHNRQRAPGSIGASSWPSRVVKGMRMAGQTGNVRVTMKNLRVVRILADQNLLLVEGAVPGARKGFVELRKKK
jgi:large subunit ribosomal protein L3